MKKKYKYDIAISFTAADRDIALCIYLALQLYRKSANGYYYPEKQGDMIGKELHKGLANIFRDEAKYVVLIVSKDYVNKDNLAVQTEINAFMERYREQLPETYLIPIQVDDTPMEQVHPDLRDITYASWDHNPKALLKIIEDDFIQGDHRTNDRRGKKRTFKNNIKASTSVQIIQGDGTTHITNKP
ncbi:MAG: TIR domain-containing protein [Flavobacteriaceae bacterium]